MAEVMTERNSKEPDFFQNQNLGDMAPLIQNTQIQSPIKLNNPGSSTENINEDTDQSDIKRKQCQK